MGKKPIFAALALLVASAPGCSLDRVAQAAPIWDDSGPDSDSGSMADASPDSGFDAGEDAGSPDAGLLDSGFDAGEDAGTDSGMADSGVFDSGVIDAGIDAGMPDAGSPPRVLTFEFERILPGGPVYAFWVREDSAGSWRSVACVGGITVAPTPNTWRCVYDITPLPSRETIRFYADFNATGNGTSSACGFTQCTTTGTHRILIDGVAQPPADISEESPTVAPLPPAGEITVKLYVTPP